MINEYTVVFKCPDHSHMNIRMYVGETCNNTGLNEVQTGMTRYQPVAGFYVPASSKGDDGLGSDKHIEVGDISNYDEWDGTAGDACKYQCDCGHVIPNVASSEQLWDWLVERGMVEVTATGETVKK